MKSLEPRVVNSEVLEGYHQMGHKAVLVCLTLTREELLMTVKNCLAIVSPSE